jgi:hypothetical protein
MREKEGKVMFGATQSMDTGQGSPLAGPICRANDLGLRLPNLDLTIRFRGTSLSFPLCPPGLFDRYFCCSRRAALTQF